MKSFYIEKNNLTIKYDPSESVLKIDGQAFLMNPFVELESFLNWLDEYLFNPLKTKIVINLTYCNSSFLKFLVNMLTRIKNSSFYDYFTIEWIVTDEENEQIVNDLISVGNFKIKKIKN